MPEKPSAPPAPHLAHPKLEYVNDATFEDFHRAIARGFQEEYHPELVHFDRKIFDHRRMFGFRVQGRWVATCGDFERRLTVPGGAAVPTAAVTVVTVHPPYRRRGLLTAMMRHQLEQVAERGEPIAALWASESLIYGRFGYGPAADRAILTGDTRRTQFLSGVRTAGSVNEVTREEYLAVTEPLHRHMLPSRPGAMVRDADVWEFAVFDKEFARGGATELRYLLHHDESGQVDAFATYRFKEAYDNDPDGEVRVGELWADNATAHASMWRYLMDLDLARTFRVRNVPVDEPLRLLVADHRAVRTEVTDALYVRLVDVEAALRARRYAAPVDLVLEVTDDILPANTGRYRLRADGVEVSVERTEDAADLSMGILELGTAYLGGVPLAELARVGRVTEHADGAVASASTAFGWHRAPWCPDHF